MTSWHRRRDRMSFTRAFLSVATADWIGMKYAALTIRRFRSRSQHVQTCFLDTGDYPCKPSWRNRKQTTPPNRHDGMLRVVALANTLTRIQSRQRVTDRTTDPTQKPSSRVNAEVLILPKPFQHRNVVLCTGRSVPSRRSCNNFSDLLQSKRVSRCLASRSARPLPSYLRSI